MSIASAQNRLLQRQGQQNLEGYDTLFGRGYASSGAMGSQHQDEYNQYALMARDPQAYNRMVAQAALRNRQSSFSPPRKQLTVSMPGHKDSLKGAVGVLQNYNPFY